MVYGMNVSIFKENNKKNIFCANLNSLLFYDGAKTHRILVFVKELFYGI